MLYNFLTLTYQKELKEYIQSTEREKLQANITSSQTAFQN